MHTYTYEIIYEYIYIITILSYFLFQFSTNSFKDKNFQFSDDRQYGWTGCR